MKHLERGQGLIEYTLVFTLIVCVVVVLVAVFFGLSVNPQDVYEREYAECIARETIVADRCHDIALMEAYPQQRPVHINR